MDSNTEKIVQEALLALEKTGLNFMLVVEDEHPNHFAIVDHSLSSNKDIKFHRDGIGYVYTNDPSGNYIELLDQES